MKIIVKLAVMAGAALLLAACQQPSSEEAVQGTVTLHEEGSPFVAFNIWFKVGSQNDPAGKEGLAALTASVLEDSSTSQDSYEQILEKLYPMASGYGSSVDKEMTVFRGVIHRDNLEGYYTLFKNAILSPAFKEEDFRRIKTQRLNFLRQQRRFSSDEELGKELLFRQIFRGTPYEHPEEGYVQSVESITLDDVKGFYARHYLRGSAVAGLGGGYPEGFVQRVRDDFNQLPEGEAPSSAPPQPQPIQGRHVLIVEKETNATAISLGYPIPLLRSHDDFYGAMLVNSWLGEHRSSASHLYQVIRERRGMNYGDYTYIEAYPMGHTISKPPQNAARRQQIFQIWIRPISMLQPGDMHDRSLFATRAALREVEALVEQGMDPAEFATRVDFLKNYTVNYGSTIGRRLGYAMDDAFYGIPGDGHLQMIRPELEKLTLEQVNQTIRTYLKIDNMWMVFITKDAEGLKQKLVSGEPSPIRYPGEKPAEVLEEDKIIQAFALQIPEENIHLIDINQALEK